MLQRVLTHLSSSWHHAPTSSSSSSTLLSCTCAAGHDEFHYRGLILHIQDPRDAGAGGDGGDGGDGGGGQGAAGRGSGDECIEAIVLVNRLFPRFCQLRAKAFPSLDRLAQWVAANAPAFQQHLQRKGFECLLLMSTAKDAAPAHGLISYAALTAFIRQHFARSKLLQAHKKQRIVLGVAGFTGCPFYERSKQLCFLLEDTFPASFTIDLMPFVNRQWFMRALPRLKASLKSKNDQEKLQQHATSPLTWTSDKEFIGGSDKFFLFIRNLLQEAPSGLAAVSGPDTTSIPDIDNKQYDYEVIVIGGGSGGLAFAKEAASLLAASKAPKAATNAAKGVCLVDFVTPSTQSTVWGLGGTCVNVGCIPKKLMHLSSLVGHEIRGSRNAGWEVQSVAFNWSRLVEGVQDYIHSLNYEHRKELKANKVEYVNAKARFTSPHSIELTDAKGKKTTKTARRFLVAVGGRPIILPIEGAREHAITSDDLFSLKRPPGKTLVIGGSYVALECAGMLHGLGYPVSLMVRSQVLRNFDREMAGKVEASLLAEGVRSLKPCSPLRITKTPSGKLAVAYVHLETKTQSTEEFDTVLMAVGREPSTQFLNLSVAGVKLDPSSKKIAANSGNQTSAPHIYAIGDVLANSPELTPVAAKQGRLLASRLFGGSSVLLDDRFVPTTVFTPVEYGFVGLSEEEAVRKFGSEDIEVFHQQFKPYEHVLSQRKQPICNCKLIVHKSDNDRVVGVHFFGPNAGEVIQGYAVALRLRATKSDFDSTLGIHPTASEKLLKLTVTKSSGKPSMQEC